MTGWVYNVRAVAAQEYEMAQLDWQMALSRQDKAWREKKQLLDLARDRREHAFEVMYGS